MIEYLTFIMHFEGYLKDVISMKIQSVSLMGNIVRSRKLVLAITAMIAVILVIVLIQYLSREKPAVAHGQVKTVSDPSKLSSVPFKEGDLEVNAKITASNKSSTFKSGDTVISTATIKNNTSKNGKFLRLETGLNKQYFLEVSRISGATGVTYTNNLINLVNFVVGPYQTLDVSFEAKVYSLKDENLTFKPIVYSQYNENLSTSQEFKFVIKKVGNLKNNVTETNGGA